MPYTSQDIYTSPVSLKSCHHTFCSSCIRTHINQSGNAGSFCPKCRQTKAYDSELIPQPVLEVTALEWKSSRSFLVRLQTHHNTRRLSPPPRSAEASRCVIAGPSKRPQSLHDGTHGESSPTRSSPRRSKRIKTDLSTVTTEPSAGSRSSPLTVQDDDDDDDDENDGLHRTDDEFELNRGQDTDADYIDSATSTHSSRAKRCSSQHSPPLRSPPPPPPLPPNALDRELKADDLVECPICSHKFTLSALHRHLDSVSCYPGFPEPSPEERGLAPKSAKPSSSSWLTLATIHSDATSSMAASEKRLHRPQYNLKSDRDLRKLLDDAGLPTSGDREKLVERHRQWVNLWNANLDSTKARRSTLQLRKELAAWERAKWSAKDHSALVDRQKTSWIQSNKSQFHSLIEKARIGAIKDHKLRHAPSTSESMCAADTPHGEHKSERQPHRISSSPGTLEAASEVTAPPQSLVSES